MLATGIAEPMPVSSETLKSYPNAVFIETGSYQGDGTQAALDAGFPRVYTIEAHQAQWEGVRDRFRDDPRVECLLGLSTTHLPGILEGLTAPATLWLDAHTCGGPTAGADACPLVEELRQIARQAIRTHTILIDDLHLCGLELPGMTELKERLAVINPNYRLSLAPSADPALGDDILVAQP